MIFCKKKIVSKKEYLNLIKENESLRIQINKLNKRLVLLEEDEDIIWMGTTRYKEEIK